MTNLPVKLHAELGASVAARWMACPGSVRLSRGQPNYQSEHAQLGTAAHAVAQMALERGKDPSAWLDEVVEGVVIDADTVDAVRVFVEFCRERMQDADAYGVEQQFNLSPLDPPGDMFGTTDFWAYKRALRRLTIADYKNGSGVVVEAVGNKQLRYYALGAVIALGAGLEIDEIEMVIVQPRAAHPEGVVRSDHISYVQLLDFAGELMDAARATMNPDAPLHAGPHCRFCPASPICPEQMKQVQLLAQTTFEAMPLDVPPAPETLPPAVLADVLDKLPILEEWAKAVRQRGQQMLESGEITPEQLGQKLVEKRATRKWTSDEATVTFLRGKGYSEDEIFKQELKSPAQIEKVMGKDKKSIPEGFIEKKSSGVTMVPLSDKRPAVALTAGEVFEALPSGE